jgi:hypothetical protein
MSRTEKEESKDACEYVFIGHTGPDYSVSISLDDKFLISGSYDSTMI